MSGKTMLLLQAKVNELNSATPTPSPAASTKKILDRDGFSTADSILQLLGLVILLVVILFAAYYTSRFVGKMTMGQLKNSNFKVIDTYRIGPNKVIQIVKIGNKFIAIAIAKDTITYLTELEESEVLIKEVPMKENQSFKQILDKLKNKGE
jgi:flagellar protein FliO/FliZ